MNWIVLYSVSSQLRRCCFCIFQGCQTPSLKWWWTVQGSATRQTPWGTLWTPNGTNTMTCKRSSWSDCIQWVSQSHTPTITPWFPLNLIPAQFKCLKYKPETKMFRNQKQTDFEAHSHLSSYLSLKDLAFNAVVLSCKVSDCVIRRLVWFCFGNFSVWVTTEKLSLFLTSRVLMDHGSPHWKHLYWIGNKKAEYSSVIQNISYHHVVPNLYDFFSSVEQKRGYLGECLSCCSSVQYTLCSKLLLSDISVGF